MHTDQQSHNHAELCATDSLPHAYGAQFEAMLSEDGGAFMDLMVVGTAAP